MQPSNTLFETDNIIKSKPYRLSINLDYTIAIVTSLLLGFSAMTKGTFFALILLVFTPIGIIKPAYLIPIYYVSSLSSQYFAVSEGLGITRVFGFAIFIGVIIRILTERKTIEGNWIRYLIYIGIATIASFISANHKYMESLLTIGMNLLILFTFANMRLSNNEVHRLFKSIFLAVVIISISILFNAILNPTVVSGRVTLSEGLNNNTFSVIEAQLSAFLFGYVLYTKSKRIKLLSISLLFLNIYLILISGSRSAFIAITAGVLVTILIINKKERLKGILVLGLIAVIGIFLFTKVIQHNPVLAYRFNLNSIISTGGTNRWERIVAEVKYIIPQNLLFGVGPISLNETIALQKYLSLPGSSHNILISMVTQIGIVGALGYIIFVYNIVKSILRRIASNSLLCIPLCLILTGIFNGVGEVVYHERFFWSALSLGILCISTNHLNSKVQCKIKA